MKRKEKKRTKERMKHEWNSQEGLKGHLSQCLPESGSKVRHQWQWLTSDSTVATTSLCQRLFSPHLPDQTGPVEQRRARSWGESFRRGVQRFCALPRLSWKSQEPPACWGKARELMTAQEHHQGEGAHREGMGEATGMSSLQQSQETHFSTVLGRTRHRGGQQSKLVDGMSGWLQ